MAGEALNILEVSLALTPFQWGRVATVLEHAGYADLAQSVEDQVAEVMEALPAWGESDED